jgi:alpha,alpha-trehalose-phosphate synthase [UDP-forming]
MVLANRLPIEQREDGTWSSSPGGLAPALSAVTEPGTQWIGWGGPASVAGPSFEHEGLVLQPMALTGSEVEGYYHGFANSVLWPLFHGRIRQVEINRTWWRQYRAVNARFARTAARTAPRYGVVWVHDYQLLLVPGMLRELRPDLRIGLFLHIPFPNVQLFSVLPWRRQLVDGMLGADVIGFQVPDDAANFVGTAERLAGVGVVDGSTLVDGVHRIEVDAFPISIDAAHWSALGRAAATRARELRAGLGVENVILGVDRLDYTKGITQRLQAFGELLDEGHIDATNCTFVQVAVPSRADVPAYQDEREAVDDLVAAINTRHGSPGNQPIRLEHRSFGEEELAAWYRAADVMMVTSLADGMNLVAKEFVAATTDLDGVLILSEFAGASHELERALIVNPYDIDALKSALVQALGMSRMERAARQHDLRAIVAREDVHRWARSFLDRLTAPRRATVGEVPARLVVGV